MKYFKGIPASLHFAIKRRSKYILVFLNGFILASIGYFYMEDSYEQRVFDTLANYVKITSQSITDTDENIKLIKASMQLTHELDKDRVNIFKGQELNTIKSDLIHPITYDLMTGKGGCGSYSYILSRILTELKIPNRIAQMKVNGSYAGHNIVEAKTSYGWVVLDPLFNLSFSRPDGRLASFEEVKNGWVFYKSQIPEGYNPDYNYAGVRYTNWNKIPIVMPAIKKVMELVIGKEETANFSLRTQMLKKFSLLFNIGLFAYFILLIYTIRKFINTRRDSKLFDPALLFPKPAVKKMALHAIQ